jgi:hypothetical protein
MTRESILLIVLAVCAVSIPLDAGAQESERKSQIRVPTGKPQEPRGVRALEVKPGLLEQGLAPFSKEDVAQYVRTHRLARSSGDLSRLEVESVELITAREVKSRLQGASTGLPDKERLAFAIIRGPVYFTGPKGSKPVAFDRAYALFDPSTGNLLMSGTLDTARPSKE